MKDSGLSPLGVLRAARKAVVLVVGLSVLAFGIALVVLPGPAILVIPLGLAILSTEFFWARRLLRNLKERAANLTRGRTSAPTGESPGRGDAVAEPTASRGPVERRGPGD